MGSYDDTAFGNVEPNYWMAGVALRDLLKPGALVGIAAGQPFIEGAVGNATQTNFEAFYNVPVTDNISLTPLVQVITNAGNQDSNGTIFTGTLRTVFSFCLENRSQESEFRSEEFSFLCCERSSWCLT
ncbi:MAG: hypothetical protein Fur006_62680 [Coleofasciculaceae cyanobacterium]